MSEEDEKFLLSMIDKLGIYDYDRLQNIIIDKAFTQFKFLEVLEKADRNGEVS